MYNRQGKMCAANRFLSSPQQYEVVGGGAVGMKVYNNTSRNIVYFFMSQKYTTVTYVTTSVM